MFRRVKGGAYAGCFFLVEDDLGGFLLRDCWLEDIPVVVT